MINSSGECFVLARSIRLQKVAGAAVALADALAALKTDDEAQKESEALYREAVRINLKRVLCVGTMVTKNSCH